MNSHTFSFGTRDAFGCTIIEKDVFRNSLGLTCTRPVTVRRASGSLYEVDAIKCTSQGHRYYQLDLSDLRIPLGSKVTLRHHGVNEVFMTVVDSTERLFHNPKSLVDAVVELQYTVQELKDDVYTES